MLFGLSSAEHKRLLEAQQSIKPAVREQVPSTTQTTESCEQLHQEATSPVNLLTLESELADSLAGAGSEDEEDDKEGATETEVIFSYNEVLLIRAVFPHLRLA
eukprot:m.181155 g.181155  ORF g.181155 m.181155 type:complete len:103 (-) comp53462_c0_seq5:258-566(-)